MKINTKKKDKEQPIPDEEKSCDNCIWHSDTEVIYKCKLCKRHRNCHDFWEAK